MKVINILSIITLIFVIGLHNDVQTAAKKSKYEELTEEFTSLRNQDVKEVNDLSNSEKSDEVQKFASLLNSALQTTKVPVHLKVAVSNIVNDISSDAAIFNARKDLVDELLKLSDNKAPFFIGQIYDINGPVPGWRGETLLVLAAGNLAHLAPKRALTMDDLKLLDLLINKYGANPQIQTQHKSGITQGNWALQFINEALTSYAPTSNNYKILKRASDLLSKSIKETKTIVKK